MSAVEKLLARLNDTSDVYVPPGVDEATYFSRLAQNIRNHICEPFEVSATVTPPGFPDIAMGSSISGECVARHAGYWLVYSPQKDTFFAFGVKMKRT